MLQPVAPFQTHLYGKLASCGGRQELVSAVCLSTSLKRNQDDDAYLLVLMKVRANKSDPILSLH
jgi:hypothetical protein